MTSSQPAAARRERLRPTLQMRTRRLAETMPGLMALWGARGPDGRWLVVMEATSCCPVGLKHPIDPLPTLHKLWSAGRLTP